MSSPPAGAPPQQARVADAELIDQQGHALRLSSLWQERVTVLVFYPGDFTRVCTAQLCEYRDRWADFSDVPATVVGINPAPWQRHAEFAAAHRYPFPILSDPSGDCCRGFRATAWWGTRRLVVVIDRQGIERWRREVLPLRRQRADEVLAAVRACVQAPSAQG